ncbi:hypothetical protein NLG97_g5615 [Lecanicillium saksenae]|uniref:Uncharacterized protein n=1 Tax=Lecanicillium saksenae TaxID=468837 RepID=A0ACC1QRY8_9HYPO|nr:hypothetical protein NLG97_g5615 [Lecanicillium saksenae]
MSSLRNLLSGKVRSQSGCYTCRLRRKKCDEKRPVCEGCAVLEITCFYGEQKPDWMDGGPKQRAMAETIKAQVKKQASQRRDRKYLEMLENGTRMVNLNDDGTTNGHASDTAAVFSESDNAFETSPSSISATTGPSPDAPWHQQLMGSNGSRKNDYDSAQDTHLIMNYVDFVFPYLFPYYQPPILVGGRGWVLDAFLHGSRSIYYTAIALSSWFFGVLLAGGEEKHAACTDRMARQLHHQMGISLTELQKNIFAISAKKDNFDIREGLSVMQSVIQMLVFEVTAANKDNWKLHLDAAVALFIKMLPQPEQWTEKLNALWTPKWPPPEMGLRRPWSTDQAALRFFGANLLYIDVMSSITMSKRPRLTGYHESVIPSCPKNKLSTEPQSAGPLLMEEFIGLQNWLVQTLGDVAALDAYKKEQQKAGTLSMADLASRGDVLVQVVKAGIRQLENMDYSQTSVERVVSVIRDPLSSLNPSSATAKPNFIIQNLIWCHAAFIYLHTVISGWQPLDPDVRRSVEKVTELLVDLPDGKTMQSMAWPFCVAGCMAPPEYHDKYRGLVTRLGPLQVFGTIQESKKIMEIAWENSASADDSWDIAKCLNSLGHGALLI